MSALPSSIASTPLLNSLRAAYDAVHDTNPTWQALRRRAWNTFIARGLPTTRDEEWKYTQLQTLSQREFSIARATAGKTPYSATPDAYHLLFVNGRYDSAQSTLPQQAGLRISVFDDPQRFPDTLAGALNIETPHRFAALNTALTRCVVSIELAQDVALDRPLQLSFVWDTEDTNVMTHPRIAFRLGRHSRLTVLEKYVSLGASATFTNAFTTLQLAEGARLEHVRIQQENQASVHIGVIQADVSTQAAFVSHQFNLGAALARFDINALLQGTDASADLNGLQFAAGTQHHDTHTLVEHVVPHTRSTEDYRGIADERGRVVFNGKVRVHPKAIGTDAQQNSRNLLLAPRAEIDTKPELEIYADDVKCAHGATIGQLDANALFYLRSRGLNEAQARGLLTQAFADVVISRVPLEAVRSDLAQAVHARFGTKVEGSA